jgi:putative transposase
MRTGRKYRKYRFWQKGGGYDRNIVKENTLLHTVRYIHNNPVRKELVEEPGKWYYSSYNCWINDVDEPIKIDKETWPLV